MSVERQDARTGCRSCRWVAVSRRRLGTNREPDATWARVGHHILAVTSWTSVLDTLQRAAGEAAVEQDVLQLRGLADQIDKEAFPPLTEDEVGHKRLARRINGYQRQVDKITDRLVELGLVRTLP